MSTPFLIAMSGLPGSGKSTIAEGIARRLSIPILSVDPIESAIITAGIARSFETGLAAYLVAEDEDPSEAYERADSEADQMELLREGLRRLDDRSRDIVKRRWLEPDSKVTLQELADEYGVSAERIRQVEANALKKMKALFAA